MSKSGSTLRLPTRAFSGTVTGCVFLGLLGLNVVMALVAYARLGTVEALESAALFTGLWAGLFVLTPVLVGLLIVAVCALLALGTLYAISALNVNPLEAILFAFIGLIALGLFFALLPLAPGALLGRAVYEIAGGGATGTVLGIGTFLVVTVVILIVWIILRDYVIPFVTGYLWASITGTLAHQIALSIVTGERAARALLDVDLSSARGAERALGSLPAMFMRLFTLEFLPAPLGVWIMLVAIVVGVMMVVQHVREKKEEQAKS